MQLDCSNELIEVSNNELYHTLFYVFLYQNQPDGACFFPLSPYKSSAPPQHSTTKKIPITPPLRSPSLPPSSSLYLP